MNKYQQIRELIYAIIGVFIYAIIAFTAISCSPQKQLNRLITKHPELKQDTIIRIDTFYIIVKETNTTQFNIQDLLALADTTLDCAPDTANTNTNKPSKQIRADTSGSTASITANADGSFNLNIEQKQDTIHVHDSINIPVYLTKTEYKDKIIYKMTKWQTFFYKIGTTITFIIAITLFLFITQLIVKHYKLL